MQIKQSFLLLVRKSRVLNCFFPTPMLSQNYTPAISVWNLAVTLGNNNNFRQHISQNSCCCFYYICDFRIYLSFAVAKTIATALVSSILDYCNSLYHNIALMDILKLQHVKFFGFPHFSHFLNHCIGFLSDIA